MKFYYRITTRRTNVFWRVAILTHRATYRNLCKKYRPQPKPETQQSWGSKLLAGMKAKEKEKKSSPGQMRLSWNDWEVKNEEIEKVAEKLIFANCYNPQFVGGIVLQNSTNSS